MSTQEFVNWVDEVEKLERNGDLQGALAIYRKNFPLPYAFKNAEVAIRKQIREKRKNKDDYGNLLEALYNTAVCENFFASVKCFDVIDIDLCSLTAQPFIGQIAHPYNQIGYKELKLLKTTDIKWLVEKWGKPNRHSNTKAANKKILKEATEKFAAAAKKSEEEFFRAHGFDPP